MDDKAEHMIKVAIATLGGGLTVALFVGQQAEIDATPSSAVLFGAGLLLNLAAIVGFIDSYVRLRKPLELYPAPDISWLESKRRDPNWDLQVHMESLVSSYARYSKHNVSKMAQSAAIAPDWLVLLAGKRCRIRLRDHFYSRENHWRMNMSDSLSKRFGRPQAEVAPPGVIIKGGADLKGRKSVVQD